MSCSPNLEESQLSVAGQAADNFTPCGKSSVSLLSGVCSSRVVMVHWADLACMDVQRGVPSAGAIRKYCFQ